MKKQLLYRFFHSFIALFFLLTLVFFSSYFSGDPLHVLLGPGTTPEQLASVKAHYGLDKPLSIQYMVYIKNLIRGNLGKSIITQRPVAEIISQRIPASIELLLVSMIIALLLALPIGVYSAVRRGSLFDLLARSFAMVGQSIPIFWAGLILMMVFSIWLGILPTGGRGGLKHLILPAFVLGYETAAGILRLTRSSMLEVLDTEYVKFARIKGLSERKVIWIHGFRNAMLPVITYTSIRMAQLVAGAITTETVFAWPGLGQLVINAARNRDLPLLQGVVLLIGISVLIVNLLVDIFYVYLDPRIRYTE